MHHSCVVISITNGSETLTFWHCFEDTSRVLLRFKLTPKLYHPNFLRNKKTKHIKQAENKENTFKKAITCEISWVITLTKEYLFLRILSILQVTLNIMLAPANLTSREISSIFYWLLAASLVCESESYFQRHPPSISVGAKGWGKYKLPASFSNYAHPSKVCWGRGSHSWVKGQINFLGSICNHDKTLAKFLELEANSANKAMYIWKPISSTALPCGLMQVETYCWPWYFLWW